MVRLQDIQVKETGGEYPRQIRVRATVQVTSEGYAGLSDVERLKEELKNRVFRELYGDVELEVRSLQRTVMTNLGLGSNSEVIQASFKKMFDLLSGETE